MNRVLLSICLGLGLWIGFTPKNAHGVFVDGGSLAGAVTWFLGGEFQEPNIVPEGAGRLFNEERVCAEQARILATQHVFRVDYLLARMMEVFFRPVDEARTPVQNRILEAQRGHLQAEWETAIQNISFYLEQGWLPWEGIREFFEGNVDNMPLVFYGIVTDQNHLQLIRWQHRLSRLIDSEVLPGSARALEAAAQEALEQTHTGGAAVAVAEHYRWARYAYDRRSEVDRRASPSNRHRSDRFAEQIAYWDAQTSDEMLWGPSSDSEDLFFFPAPVTLDRVIEIRALHTHYGPQTRIIVDDGELNQPHAHWGHLFTEALTRAHSLAEAGKLEQAELYMLFALYLKTGQRGWLLLLKEHSDADGPVREAIVLPELNAETAPVFSELFALLIRNGGNPLGEDSIYRSVLQRYFQDASNDALEGLLGHLGQFLSPNVEVSVSTRIAYARLIAECLGAGFWGLQCDTLRDAAYEVLIKFISNHLSIRGDFEGQNSLAVIVPMVRTMIQPEAGLSNNQLGRLLSWMQRMLGGVGFKNILKERYNYSDEQIQALVRAALITIGDIAEALPSSELPHNEMIASMFLLWGHFTNTYGEQARGAMGRVVEHWSFEQMQLAFDRYCRNRMIGRTWAEDYQRLVQKGVISA